ncbi:MAG: lasso peptide biosynthesis B2 protein [Thiohalocapsa sp.]|uniref:lasso peptide biosynthesis B2 protein n=1 Tax=Thiohalocapsa sp. TaxID=2497641 RepID=UPI0025EAC4CF|nr:lasso peptide biosynthesis B2 protein [Thiohalocapsa sp.]MCG6941460.1 lasso peptide biosynthesis B2 protein [Thiohalocapsa sp.]
MTSPAGPAVLPNKLRKLRREPGFVWLWLGPTWALLGLSRGLIALVPFRRLAPLLGTNVGVEPWVPLVSAVQAVRARLIGRSVQIAARYTPWESNCFPQAITARLLLGLYRIPFALYLGLARDRDNNDLSAHAWVTAGPMHVAGGGADFERFTVVGCFVAPVLAKRMGLPVPRMPG